MIFGVGTDIVQVKRFEKLLRDSSFISRFFNEKEMVQEDASLQKKCEHYAARFAVKESFSKALGTGIQGFSLKEVYIVKNSEGNPLIQLEGKALELFNSRCGEGAKAFVSISHEKEYAVAFTVIERS